jgi:hypothetical protein
MFLDKEIEVDLDKVQIEMPVNDVAPEPELKSSEPQSANDAVQAAAAADKASEQSAAEEQKRIDDLFKK